LTEAILSHENSSFVDNHHVVYDNMKTIMVSVVESLIIVDSRIKSVDHERNRPHHYCQCLSTQWIGQQALRGVRMSGNAGLLMFQIFEI
jgi:hypothetical protein